jgi:hypothetical protein
MVKLNLLVGCTLRKPKFRLGLGRRENDVALDRYPVGVLDGAKPGGDSGLTSGDLGLADHMRTVSDEPTPSLAATAPIVARSVIVRVDVRDHPSSALPEYLGLVGCQKSAWPVSCGYDQCQP